jgi:hypothetical protein
MCEMSIFDIASALQTFYRRKQVREYDIIKNWIMTEVILIYIYTYRFQALIS